MYPHLRDEEARVIENTIRLAVDSIINVLASVDCARAHANTSAYSPSGRSAAWRRGRNTLNGSGGGDTSAVPAAAGRCRWWTAARCRHTNPRTRRRRRGATRGPASGMGTMRRDAGSVR